jgi:hypothetical protein
MLTPRYVSPLDAPVYDLGPSALRSRTSTGPQITILAPAHVAWSAAPTPTLTWHLDRVPSDGGFYLTVTDAEDEDIIENHALPPVETAGIQSFSLEALDVQLRPGVDYRWSIAHRIAPESPPTQFAFGWLRYVPPSQGLRAKLDRVGRGEQPEVFAGSGYWYDALSATLGLIRDWPDDDRPEQALRALLDQAEIELPAPEGNS